MRLPIICLDPRFRQYLQRFRHCFSKPQYKYIETRQSASRKALFSRARST